MFVCNSLYFVDVAGTKPTAAGALAFCVCAWEKRRGGRERGERKSKSEGVCVWEFVRSGLTRDCNACLAGTYVHKKEEDTCHMRRMIHVI